MSCHVGSLIRLPIVFSSLVWRRAEFAVKRPSALTRKNREHDPLLDSKCISPSALGLLPRLSQQREVRAADSWKDRGWMPQAAENARYIIASLSLYGTALRALPAAGTPSVLCPVRVLAQQNPSVSCKTLHQRWQFCDLTEATTIGLVPLWLSCAAVAPGYMERAPQSLGIPVPGLIEPDDWLSAWFLLPRCRLLRWSLALLLSAPPPRCRQTSIGLVLTTALSMVALKKRRGWRVLLVALRASVLQQRTTKHFI